MAQTIVNVIEVKVPTGRQAITVYVKPYPNNSIYARDGQTTIQPGGTLTVEDNRIDQMQLESMQRNGVLQFSRGTRVISVTISGGSTGA